VDLGVLRRALTDSAVSSAFIRSNLGALLAGDYMTGFGLDCCCEEVTTVTAVGREHDVPLELSALVERIHQHALTRYGPADGELLAIALPEEQAGIRLRHGPA
jgi:3-hydroxyisobutyrate dehydrogenase